MLQKWMQGGKLIFVGLIVVLVAVLVFMASSLTSARSEANELRASTEAQVAAREADIRKDERSLADAEWEEREKYCNAGGRGNNFVGPDDYGRFGFYHPCTWAIYVPYPARQGGQFEAIFHPRKVVMGSGEIYALRFSIVTQSYDSVLQARQSSVQSGLITQSTFTNIINQGMSNEYKITGTRFDGQMVPGVQGGSEVIFKVRDKTAIVRTDSSLFKDDFERLVKSIVYTP
ncbi:MAG: hypothetical protein LBM12_03300 [Candidatus Nomurabacteria bacterium]|jgi:hypothetical protein|nr:hypothetical protein [Candidatus Nomurabacteria bacterium]